LLDKSLLRQEQVEDELRLVMLVTIREFAAEHLQRSGEAPAVAQAHAAYYCRLAETAAPKLYGHEQQHWLDSLERDHDNLRAALTNSLNQGDIAKAVRLGRALWRFWLLRGYLSEGQRWLTMILDFNDQSKIQNLKSKIAAVLTGAGVLTYYLGNLGRSVALLRQSLALCRELEDQEGILTNLQGLARVGFRSGQFADAEAMYLECLAISRQLNDAWGIAHALAYLGLIYWGQGNYTAARPPAEEAVARFQAIGDPQSIAQSLQALGWVMSALGDWAAARARFAESLPICRQLKDRAGIARGLYGLGFVLLRQGEKVAVCDLLDEALILLLELGDKYHFYGGLGIVADLATQTGHWLQAARLLGAANAIEHSIGSTMPAFVQATLAASLATLRPQLDQAAAKAAWAEGQAMPLEQLYTAQKELLGQIRAELAPPIAHPAGLTEREVEVLRLLAQGLTNIQIAQQLIVSPYTVNAHVRSIYNKLDVTSRAAATRFALANDLL
jgi:DNA-binding CsgD family transcriptional regulator/tetratricopeptide (TPR) repeat protein